MTFTPSKRLELFIIMRNGGYPFSRIEIWRAVSPMSKEHANAGRGLLAGFRYENVDRKWTLQRYCRLAIADTT